MGVYMSKPVKEKESTDYENKLLKCGASSMQGWRVSQEDAHNCCMDFDEEVSLFAVYDGHGGHEVAEYASKHLPGVIKSSELYLKGDYENALMNSFLDFDAMLRTESVMEELTKIAADGRLKKSGNALGFKTGTEADDEEGDDEDDDGEESGIQRLKEEADMPLAEVIAKYAEGVLKTPKSKLAGECSKKPLSPFLRASRTSSSSDAEVSSSSSNSNSTVKILNGELSVETNGHEVKDNEVEVAGSSKDIKPECSKAGIECENQVSSSSASASSHNGEVATSSMADELPDSSSKAKSSGSGSSVSIAASSLLEETFSEEDSEIDESFKGGDLNESSDDDSDEGEGLNGDADMIGEDESDGEDEEEEDEEEEEEEEEEDDDELKGSEEPGMESGCTAVVALVTKDKLYVANAGDSRGVLSRNGVAIDLSVDHKPEDPLELKRIQAAGGKVTADGRVNGGLNLSRALGDHFYKRSSELPAAEQMITALPDIKTETIDRNLDEFIVLACDGIWNSMTSQEVVDFVRPLLQKGNSLSSICEKLFDACLAPDTLGDGTGCDNMTCVIVQFCHVNDNKRSSSPLAAPSVDGTDKEEQTSKKQKIDGS